METTVFILLFIGVIGQKDISEKEIPEKCSRPAEFMLQQCCVFPPFFTRDVAKVCGAFFELISADPVNNITAIRRHPLTLCDHWKCVLEKYGLLNADETLDDEKYYKHLDRWIVLNPKFTQVIGKAKNHCRKIFRMFLPVKVCEFYTFHGCIRNFVQVHCPVVFPTKDCHEVKLFYDECEEYFL